MQKKQKKKALSVIPVLVLQRHTFLILINEEEKDRRKLSS